MTAALANVPVEAEVLAEVLDRQHDYRVLRRLRPMVRAEPHGVSSVVLRGVALDLETTGLDPTRDRVIELAIQAFGADAQGRIVSTDDPRGWLEDPGVPIPPEVTRVTGIRATDVEGRSIHEGEAYAILASADVLVAHNARFDAPALVRRIPGIAGRPWLCSLAGVDWRAEGFEGRTLSQLCGRMGWFYEAHRAGVDVSALLQLLDHRLSDGETVLKRLLDRERRPTWLIEVPGAPRDAGDALKERGYRWNPDRRVWAREVTDRERADEEMWATIRVYHAARSPDATRIDWTTRYVR